MMAPVSLQAKFASKALHSNLEVFLGLGQRAGEAMRHAFLETHKDFRDVRPSPPMPLSPRFGLRLES